MDPDLLDLVYAAHVLLGFCVVLGVIAVTILCLICTVARRSLYEITDIVSDTRFIVLSIGTDLNDAGFFDRKYKVTDADQGESPVFDEEDEVPSRRRGPP